MLGLVLCVTINHQNYHDVTNFAVLNSIKLELVEFPSSHEIIMTAEEQVSQQIIFCCNKTASVQNSKIIRKYKSM